MIKINHALRTPVSRLTVGEILESIKKLKHFVDHKDFKYDKKYLNTRIEELYEQLDFYGNNNRKESV
jgi:NADH:ubiquinone oxidoreductase subunit E